MTPRRTRSQINAEVSQCYLAVYAEHRGHAGDLPGRKAADDAVARDRALAAAQRLRRALEAERPRPS